MLERRQLGLVIREFEGTFHCFDGKTSQPSPNDTDFPEATRTVRENLAAGRKQIDLKKKKADREARKARAEREKSQASEAELARLRELLEGRGIGS